VDYCRAQQSIDEILFLLYIVSRRTELDGKNKDMMFIAWSRIYTDISFIVWVLIYHNLHVGWFLAMPILHMSATRLLNSTNLRLSSSYFGVNTGKVVPSGISFKVHNSSQGK
jgi:hypothetical protein